VLHKSKRTCHGSDWCRVHKPISTKSSTNLIGRKVEQFIYIAFETHWSVQDTLLWLQYEGREHWTWDPMYLDHTFDHQDTDPIDNCRSLDSYRVVWEAVFSVSLVSNAKYERVVRPFLSARCFIFNIFSIATLLLLWSFFYDSEMSWEGNHGLKYLPKAFFSRKKSHHPFTIRKCVL